MVIIWIHNADAYLLDLSLWCVGFAYVFYDANVCQLLRLYEPLSYDLEKKNVLNLLFLYRIMSLLTLTNQVNFFDGIGFNQISQWFTNFFS